MTDPAPEILSPPNMPTNYTVGSLDHTGWHNKVGWLLNADLPLNAKSMFGAVGDGVHDDTTALQNFLTALASRGGVGYIPAGIYRTTSGLSLLTGAQPFLLRGAGQRATIIRYAGSTALNLFNFRSIGAGTVRDLTLDGGMVGAHCISASNCSNMLYECVEGINFTGMAILATHSDTYAGSNQENHIVNCVARGAFVGTNGFSHSGATRSHIVDCYVYDLSRTATPSYGLQLKGGCTDCTIRGGIVDGARAGIGFGNEAGVSDGIHSGNFITGVTVRNCLWGVYGSKMQGNTIDIVVDMNGDTSNIFGASIATTSQDNDIRLSILGMHAAAIVFKADASNSNMVRIGGINSFPTGAKIAQFSGGADLNIVRVGPVGGKGFSNTYALPVDVAGAGINNRVSFEVYDTERHSPDGVQPSYMRFTSPSTYSNWMAFHHDTNEWKYRIAGTDAWRMSASWFRPAFDVTASIGTSTARVTEVWTRDGVLIASPNGTMYRVTVSNTGVLAAVPA